MTVFMTRRAAMIGSSALITASFSTAAFAAPLAADTLAKQFAELEKRSKGRLGVVVLDTANGTIASYRGDERFPLCSTFKMLLGAAVLARVDAGTEKLDRQISFTQADLIPHAPIVEKHMNVGHASVGVLCAGAIQYSDNVAANLLLPTIGGPAGLTRYMASIGDSITRLDRNEPTLNTSIPGDPRDTTTPVAMVGSMEKLLVGNALSAASRHQLNDWMIGNTTGGEKIRKGLPADWKVGDKTGMGDNGSTNDVAILWPPRRKPLLVAVYLTECKEPVAARNAVHAEVGRLVSAAFGDA
jgi:beta-lactamase class A